MKTKRILLSAVISALLFANQASAQIIYGSSAQELNWYSFEDALSHSRENSKMIIVDVYTDWCGYCKKMDNETYADPEVVKVLNEHFYCIKIDAESEAEVSLDDETFTEREIAISLLDGDMSYPSTVFITREGEILYVLPGFHEPKTFEVILAYLGTDAYLDTDFEVFQEHYETDKDM